MTGRERITAAISHQEPDRVPVAPRVWAWLTVHYGDASLPTYLRFCEEFGGDAFWCEFDPTPNYVYSWPDEYDLPEVRVEQHRYRDGDYTVVERTFYTPAGPLRDKVRIAPPMGRWGVAPDPVIVEPLVKTREDLQRLPYILAEPVRDMSGYHAAERAVGQRGVVELYISGPLDCQAAEARGMERLMTDYYDDQQFFDEQVELFHRRTMELTRVALEEGVRFIFAAWTYASLSAGWSPKIWREVFLPRLKEHVELVHSAGAVYHFYDDGRLAKLLPLLAEAGVDIVSTCTPPPMGDFDLAEAKSRFGKELCFKGYIDLLYVMQRATPELVEEKVREALEVGKPGGGFILGTSDSLREGTPVENIRAYFEAARKYGWYK